MRRIERIRAGFTRAKLMVVIVIISLLAATLVVPDVVPRCCVMSSRAAAESNIVTLGHACEDYARDMGRYPETLEHLVMPREESNSYLQRDTVPADPWGNPFLYEPPSLGRKANITSYGEDGAPGGEGDDADITLEQIRNS